MPCVTLSYSNWFLSLTISNTMPKTSPDSNNRPPKKRGEANNNPRHKTEVPRNTRSGLIVLVTA